MVTEIRILVTGASGLVGSSLVAMAKEAHEVYSAFNQHTPTAGIPIELNLADNDRLQQVVEKLKPEIIVHAAALTDVDLCERERDLATKVNHLATDLLAKISSRLGAFMVYISTDYVFSGEQGSYREDDDPGPVNFYGLTKLRGEEAVSGLAREYCIARTSVVYGSTPAAGKVNLALWILERLKRKEYIRIAYNQYASPTLNSNLANMVLEIIDRRLTGIYHLSGAVKASRYEFAIALARNFDMDVSLVVPSTMAEMKWFAKRPMDSSLDVSKAIAAINTKPLDMSNALSILKKELQG